MILEALFWLFLNIIWTAISGYYSMMEMACVSFNRVRLQYYVNKDITQATWLNAMLKNPARLFGTTLIGVNIATVIGSECARETYAALGIPPDLAPLTQVVFVVIFGELAPMFAARHYPEHVVMLGMWGIYYSAKVMAPLLWIIHWLSKACHFFYGGKKGEKELFLTQEELTRMLEEQDEESHASPENLIARNIFKLKTITASQVMKPLTQFKLLHSNATVKEMREILTHHEAKFLPIYHRNIYNIVGVAYPRDMLRAQENKRVRDQTPSPWFIVASTPAMQILHQFRNNNKTVAVVLNDQGRTIGILSLDDLIEQVYGQPGSEEESSEEMDTVLIDRTFPGEMRVGEFNGQFEVVLDKRDELTLSELLNEYLGHHPEVGETLYLPPFTITVKEVSLIGVKEVTISTKMI